MKKLNIHKSQQKNKRILCICKTENKRGTKVYSHCHWECIINQKLFFPGVNKSERDTTQGSPHYWRQSVYQYVFTLSAELTDKI